MTKTAKEKKKKMVKRKKKQRWETKAEGSKESGTAPAGRRRSS
jgi:hypothetical protein